VQLLYASGLYPIQTSSALNPHGFSKTLHLSM
jgi:hypothetical protein